MSDLRCLVLEDDSNRIKEFNKRLRDTRICFTSYVDTAELAIQKLKESDYDIIFLDHDLGGETYVDTNNKNTGSEVARWISKNPIKGLVIVHSLNKPAADGMVSLIPGAIHFPFVWTEENFKRINLPC